MGIELRTVNIADLRQAPWRFSEDRSRPFPQFRKGTPILENIVSSLETVGQLTPIHVRRLYIHGADPLHAVYEILDGHIVVEAAKQVGMTTLQAINHDLSNEAAYLFYVHMNLNRCGQYGHFHVKLYRSMRNVIPDDITATTARAEVLKHHMAWPVDRIVDYCELDERGDNWQKWIYKPKDDASEHQPNMYGDTEPDVVADNL